MKKYSPQPVSALDAAFGGRAMELLPEWTDIPDEFKHGETRWNEIVADWFFKGLRGDTLFTPKDGIDKRKALTHIATIMRSFEPKHEHKTAGCAYLLSLWFDDIVIPEKKAP